MASPFTLDQLTAMRGKPVYDRASEKIGDIKAVFHDDATGQPEWLGVSSGFLGTKTMLVPVAGATQQEDGLLVPYSKDQVKDAPGAAGEHVTEAEEQALYQHYGLDYSRQRSSSGLPNRDQSMTTTPTAQPIRSSERADERTIELREEELRARKERVQAGEVRVEKEVVAEQRTLEVPVTREEVVVERQAVNRPSDRPIGEATNEVIEVPVYEEEVTAEKRTVVREELEIGKRAVQETEQVSGTVRREEARLETEGTVHLRDDDQDNPRRRQ